MSSDNSVVFHSYCRRYSTKDRKRANFLILSSIRAIRACVNRFNCEKRNERTARIHRFQALLRVVISVYVTTLMRGIPKRVKVVNARNARHTLNITPNVDRGSRCTRYFQISREHFGTQIGGCKSMFLSVYFLIIQRPTYLLSKILGRDERNARGNESDDR